MSNEDSPTRFPGCAELGPPAVNVTVPKVAVDGVRRVQIFVALEMGNGNRGFVSDYTRWAESEAFVSLLVGVNVVSSMFRRRESCLSPFCCYMETRV